jgi:CBS domain-containing protein
MTSTTPTGQAVRAADDPTAHLSASDVMTSDIVTVTVTTTVGEAVMLMRNLGIRHLPVVGGGRFSGMVDDRLAAFAMLTATGPAAALEQPVGTVMTQFVPHAAASDSLQRVAHLLRTSRCDAVVVVDAQEHLLGIITVADVVSAVALGSAVGAPQLVDAGLTTPGAQS